MNQSIVLIAKKERKGQGVSMGRYDETENKNPLRTVTVVLVFLLLFSLAMELFQNGTIRDLEKKLEKIEPIIDDYCMSSNSKLEYCAELLEGYNDEDRIVNVFP